MRTCYSLSHNPFYPQRCQWIPALRKQADAFCLAGMTTFFFCIAEVNPHLSRFSYTPRACSFSITVRKISAAASSLPAWALAGQIVSS